jgi:hypothetical protein
MWNVKTKLIPVMVEATETMLESFRKYLLSVLGQQDIKELQKTAILGTAHTLREVLMSEYRTLNMRNNITCTINCTNRKATTLSEF